MTEATHNLLEKHFDTAFAAPEGVKKLRELILALAMQGKLVPQDPSDPPASKLLKEIEAEKKRLVKEGKIKPPKPLPEIKPEEIPYELPKGWTWVRLGHFLEMINGRAFKPSDWISGGLPIVRIQNLNNPCAPFNFCGESDVKEQHIINNGEFLISWSGTPGTSFGAFIWSGSKAALNQHIFRCFQIGSPCNDNFLRQAINSRLEFLIDNAQGAVGLKHVTKGTLQNMLLPLPPLAEQHRIVAKVDQLMARCDELEKLRKERDEKRLAVHAAALKQLLDAEAKEGFSGAWGFINKHFGELYSIKENVAELRKAILQLAVMGKLSSHHEEDETVSVLLSRVKKERQHLKYTKSSDVLKSPSKIGFDIPRNWEWVKLEDLLIFGPTNGLSPRAVDYETKYRSLTLSATTSGVFKGEYFKYVDIDIEEDSYLWLYDGDILVQRGNTIEYVGVPAVYTGKPKTYIYPDLMMKIRISSYIDTNYIYYVMSSAPCRNYLRSNASGTSGTMPKINQSALKNLPIPIPPISEQHRIVAKIDQLMALCDTLEAAIDDATAKQTALLNAVMAAV